MGGECDMAFDGSNASPKPEPNPEEELSMGLPEGVGRPDWCAEVNLLPKLDEKSLSKARLSPASGFGADCRELMLHASVSALLPREAESLPSEGRPDLAARKPFHALSSSSPNLVSNATGLSGLCGREGALEVGPCGGRPRRIGAIASRTFSRASTPAFFPADC